MKFQQQGVRLFFVLCGLSFSPSCTETALAAGGAADAQSRGVQSDNLLCEFLVVDACEDAILEPGDFAGGVVAFADVYLLAQAP